MDMIEPMDALVLAMDAHTKPIEVLRYMASTDWRLRDALTLADQEFNPYEASQFVREASVVLGLVADALKTHALSRPFPTQRTRPAKEIKAEEIPF